jgi:hypothetical protein
MNRSSKISKCDLKNSIEIKEVPFDNPDKLPD